MGLCTRFVANLKIAFLRVIFNRLTVSYFLLTILHAFVQAIIQSLAFGLVVAAKDIATSNLGSTNPDLIAREIGSQSLQLCPSLPLPFKTNDTNCFTVFPPTSLGTTAAARREQCSEVLLWLQQLLRVFKLQSIAFLFFQAFQWGFSHFALMRESVPQIWAALATQSLQTLVAFVQLSQYLRLVHLIHTFVDPPPCAAPTLFDSTLSSSLIAYQALSPTISTIVFAAQLHLTIKLSRQFLSHSNQRIGPPKELHGKIIVARTTSVIVWVLSFLILSPTSILVAMVSLGPIAAQTPSTDRTLIRAAFFFTLITVYPWIWIGWEAVHQENKKLMAIYLIMNVIYLLIWSLSMLISTTQFLLFTWGFFTSLFLSTFGFLILSLALGVLCRLNFGQGLGDYFKVQRILSESGFSPDAISQDPERVGRQKRLPLPNDSDRTRVGEKSRIGIWRVKTSAGTV